jgi:hypothetical protein
MFDGEDPRIGTDVSKDFKYVNAYMTLGMDATGENVELLSEPAKSAPTQPQPAAKPQPKPQPKASSTEAKKADIERRRQEEFDQYENDIIVKTELYEDGEGRKYLVHTLKNGKKRLDTANEEGKRTSTLDVYESSVPVEKYIMEAKKISDIEVKPSKQENRINAKYDAEYIDKVKKGEFTKQQAKDALKEIGRLTPELEKQIDDAELAALEGKQPAKSTKLDEQKIVDALLKEGLNEKSTTFDKLNDEQKIYFLLKLLNSSEGRGKEFAATVSSAMNYYEAKVMKSFDVINDKYGIKDFMTPVLDQLASDPEKYNKFVENLNVENIEPIKSTEEVQEDTCQNTDVPTNPNSTIVNPVVNPKDAINKLGDF